MCRRTETAAFGDHQAPRIGFVSQQSYRKIYADAVEDVTAWLDGEPIREPS